MDQKLYENYTKNVILSIKILTNNEFKFELATCWTKGFHWDIKRRAYYGSCIGWGLAKLLDVS